MSVPAGTAMSAKRRQRPQEPLQGSAEVFDFPNQESVSDIPFEVSEDDPESVVGTDPDKPVYPTGVFMWNSAGERAEIHENSVSIMQGHGWNLEPPKAS